MAAMPLGHARVGCGGDSASADEDEDDGEGSDGEERDGEEVAEAGKELEAKEEEAGKEGKAGEEGLMAGGAGVMEEGGSESEAGEEEEAEGEGEELEAEAAAEEAASDDEEDGSIGTMQLPAQSLAALLRLLPNLHTVDLPPSSPYADPDDGELVCSALAKLPNLSDLTISSITLADQLGPLSGLQHLTRLVVGTLDPISDVQGAGHYWADEMEADGVEAICGLSGLRHLELRPWRVMQVWDAMLADMLHALPHLEHVTVRGVSAMEWHDDSGGHGFLGHHNTLSLDLASGSITAIDIETSSFCETSPNAARAVSLGLLAHFCKTMLLPCVAPASAPPVKRLRLRCSLALSDADPDPAGEWAAPLRELVGRCAAVEVESMDLSLEAAGRRVAAAEVEALVRLLGVPERICLGRHTPCSQGHWVQLRRPGEAGALGCGGGGGEGVPAPAPARDVPEGALKHLRYEDLAQALQALWDDGAAGTELQRLRRMLVAVTVPPRPQPQPAPQHLMHPFMPEDW
ncbi:hypothetical protein HYH03_006073 [Edaphochlamys debaryana]|uniref:Uncharacterized protein n=1 Tax=Edaphochlamys debaryana TaxID=47281 RepID=A0A836C1S4_9CHLO|nr:hypothetical protein HYH03_006073 [Edaphochlamys debaryana]|eukprot:KAG2495834.1 hypothetical protein HYH03_006073 [Edaphochlamys debaryana]